MPFATMRPIRKPNGDAPESTPAATEAERRILASLMPPEVTPGFWNVLLPPAGVIGSAPAGVRLPILASVWPPNWFHCTPSSRPAVRVTSTKRTSSITCCGDMTDTELMISGPNWRAMVTALSRVAASGTSPDSMMRPLTEETCRCEPGKRRRELVAQPGDVVGHLDVEDADQLLALGIDRHARGADLLAEDRQRVVGQRIDVGDIRIADRDVDEAVVGAHVLRLADGDRHHGGALVAADLDGALLRLRLADHAKQRRHQRNRECDRDIAQPRAARSAPVRTPPRETDGVFVVVIHDTLPAPE